MWIHYALCLIGWSIQYLQKLIRARESPGYTLAGFIHREGLAAMISILMVIGLMMMVKMQPAEVEIAQVTFRLDRIVAFTFGYIPASFVRNIVLFFQKK